MKKYMISRQVAGLYFFCLFFLVCFAGISTWQACKYEFSADGFPLIDFSHLERSEPAALIPLVVGGVGSLMFLYYLLFDYMGGKFSVNQDGITMYIGFKRHYHPWSDFNDFGFLDIEVGRGNNTIWAYFSTQYLNADERRLFLRKTRKDLENVAFFQYNKKEFSEIISLLPLQMAEKLREDESYLI